MSYWECPGCSLVTDEPLGIEPHLLRCLPPPRASWDCPVCRLSAASFDELVRSLVFYPAMLSLMAALEGPALPVQRPLAQGLPSARPSTSGTAAALCLRQRLSLC